MYKIMTPGPTQVRDNVRAARSLRTTNPVVYYKHFVALFGKGSAGRFKTENTLAR